MAMKLDDTAGSFTDINMTPLIDVMLVLLIIFIISLPMVTHAIKIDNPLSTLHPPPATVVSLTIDFDGTVSWNGTAVDRKTLQRYITQQAGEDPQRKSTSPSTNLPSMTRWRQFWLICRAAV